MIWMVTHFSPQEKKLSYVYDLLFFVVIVIIVLLAAGNIHIGLQSTR